MEYDMGFFCIVLMIGIVSLYGFLNKANEWFCLKKLDKAQCILPPGDLGWPFVGNMLSFVKSYKYGDPESFISSFTTRSNNKENISRSYKAATEASATDNDRFNHIDYIKEIVIAAFDKLAIMEEPIELLTKMRKYASQVIMTVIMGNKIDQKWFDIVETEFSVFVDGIFALPVDLPGFSYHRALTVSFFTRLFLRMSRP
ncbi:hypothetical protein K7X08_004356 [Anisodus acutangulus]|uniref:Cytochrome P450 n=1 Tax=Anisodus acutangulus TaxID=402998 RepID=A0A9Q1MKJ6_9SOLA|nr:hypothetical protein K7X08_004356 [Anisodus acutangulus]